MRRPHLSRLALLLLVACNSSSTPPPPPPTAQPPPPPTEAWPPPIPKSCNAFACLDELDVIELEDYQGYGRRRDCQESRVIDVRARTWKHVACDRDDKEVATHGRLAGSALRALATPYAKLDTTAANCESDRGGTMVTLVKRGAQVTLYSCHPEVFEELTDIADTIR